MRKYHSCNIKENILKPTGFDPGIPCLLPRAFKCAILDRGNILNWVLKSYDLLQNPAMHFLLLRNWGLCKVKIYSKHMLSLERPVYNTISKNIIVKLSTIELFAYEINYRFTWTHFYQKVKKCGWGVLP